MTWHTFWHKKHSMHLWNSCARSTSNCDMRYTPSAGRGAGVNGGMRLAISKLNETSVTRSRMIGKVRIGEIVIGSLVSSVLMRVMHMRRGWPLISAEQEPHLPALQFQR